MFEITTLVGGAVFGAGLAWILERWISLSLKQFAVEDSEAFPQKIQDNEAKVFSRWGIFSIMTIATAALTIWRQWSPELFNDLILLTTLVGIAWIDKKTLLIEGRMLALALVLRVLWLSYFEPHLIINSVAGLLVGAGLLYIIGFLYQTIRHRQGLGEGDAAVLGLIGMWVGWQGLGTVLLIAAVSGILIGGISLLRQKNVNQNIPELLQTQIPFAPFLCIGGLIVYFLQETGFVGNGFGF